MKYLIEYLEYQKRIFNVHGFENEKKELTYAVSYLKGDKRKDISGFVVSRVLELKKGIEQYGCGREKQVKTILEIDAFLKKADN